MTGDPGWPSSKRIQRGRPDRVLRLRGRFATASITGPSSGEGPIGARTLSSLLSFRGFSSSVPIPLPSIQIKRPLPAGGAGECRPCCRGPPTPR